jgi:hypothetical protein
MVDRFANVYPNLNQFYMAGLMAAPMVLIELALMGHMYPNKVRSPRCVRDGKSQRDARELTVGARRGLGPEAISMPHTRSTVSLASDSNSLTSLRMTIASAE